MAEQAVSPMMQQYFEIKKQHPNEILFYRVGDFYEMFFEGYTEKVWGVHPSKLGADWGSQRVKGLSIMSVLKDMFRRALGLHSKHVETSLIEQFIYPKYGPGQLWETVADDIRQLGGEIHMQHEVIGVNMEQGRVVSVVARTADGGRK